MIADFITPEKPNKADLKARLAAKSDDLPFYKGRFVHMTGPMFVMSLMTIA